MNSRRKLAALEIEKIVKKKIEQGTQSDRDDVLVLADTLVAKYARPPCQANQRKGALLCLAAIAVGLNACDSDLGRTPEFLERVLPTVLSSATDGDERVRYYALESLYNVIKSTTPNVVEYTTKIFDLLFRLCDDSDTSVQNAAMFVSDLLKDGIAAASPKYSVRPLLQLLISCLPVKTSSKRRFLIGWVSFADSLPLVGEEFARAMPDIVPGIMLYLGDPMPEVSHPAEKLLKQLLGDLENGVVSLPVDDMVDALARCILYVEDGQSSELPFMPSSVAVTVTTLRWLEVIVDTKVSRAGKSYPKLIKCCLKCLDSTEYGVQDLALALNTKLREGLEKLEQVDYASLLDVAVQKIGSTQELARLEALRWTVVSMKSDNMAAKQIKPLLLHLLCEALASTSDQVVRQALEALVSNSCDDMDRVICAYYIIVFYAGVWIHDLMVALLMVLQSVLSSVDEEGLSLTMRTVIRVFEGPAGTMLLQRRGNIILENLCGIITSEKLLTALVSQLQGMSDTDLRRMMIQALNLLLLTSDKVSHPDCILSSAISS